MTEAFPNGSPLPILLQGVTGVTIGNPENFNYNGNAQILGINITSSTVANTTITPVGAPWESVNPTPPPAAEEITFNVGSTLTATPGLHRGNFQYRVNSTSVPVGLVDHSGDILLLRVAFGVDLASLTSNHQHNILLGTDVGQNLVTSISLLTTVTGLSLADGGVGNNRTFNVINHLIPVGPINTVLEFEISGGVGAANPNMNNQGFFSLGFIDTPRPSEPTGGDNYFIGGKTGTPQDKDIGVDPRGSTSATMTITSTTGLTLTPVNNSAFPYEVTVDGTTGGYYQPTFTMAGTTGATDRNGVFHAIVLENNGSFNLGSMGTETFQLMDPSGTNASDITGITFTGLPGLQYNNTTKELELTDANKIGKTAGPLNLTWSATVSGGGTITGDLDITLTGIPFNIQTNFVGGKYSGEACSTKNGNCNNSTVTGATLDRLTLLNDLISLIGSIIRNRVDSEYMDPTATSGNADDIFHDESGSNDYPAALATTITFFVDGATGNIADSITKIVEKYFRQFRTFVLKFYNYTPSPNLCGENDVPGFESCVADCNSSVSLTFSQM